MTEYQRSMPSAVEAFRRKPSLWSYTHLDAPLLLLLLLLCGFGLFVQFSASGQDMGAVVRQGIRISVGFVALIILAQFRPAFIGRWIPLVYVGMLVMLACVLLFGVGAKGATRWLQLPGFRIQPSEFMKLALPIMVAFYLARKPLPPRLVDIAVALVLVAIPTLMIKQQPDLGTSLLIGASGIFVLLFSGIKWRWIFTSIGAGLAALPLLWMTMAEYQKQRVLTFLEPEKDPLGSGWNIIQSKTAIGSGGVSGKGWLTGTQSQLDFLPESHTDFIIAVIAEELGLLGVLFLMLLYACIIGRGLYLAASTRHSFGRLASGSIILTFFVYVVVNMGMVSGVLPVVGVPLPMVSYGGTSVVTLLAGFGVMMAMSADKTMAAK